MRVLLIASNTALTSYPVYPIGCSMVAAALDNAGHEVRQFDFMHQNSSLDALGQAIEEYSPELIGISIRNIDNVIMVNEKWYIDVSKSIVNKIREITDAVVILGGAGFSLIPDLILREIRADYGIVGEGERLMVDFTNNAARGTYPVERLIKCKSRIDGKKIPSARYDKQLLEYYLSKSGIASIQTKRGCNLNCVYCTYPLLEGNKIRHRDPVSVVDDMELLYNHHKARHIFFVDSVFNDDEGIYLNVVNEMRRRKVVIPWTAFFKPEGLNNEVLKLMKQTGLIAVELGSDSIVDTTLRGLGKRFTSKDIVECNDMIVKHGISISHYFIMGGPGETEETVLEGIERIKSLKGSASFIFTGLRILPDTTLHTMAINEGFISPDDGLLKPVFYLSGSIDKEWLDETLAKSFSGLRHCIYPADSLDDKARILYGLGCTGSLLNWLV